MTQATFGVKSKIMRRCLGREIDQWNVLWQQGWEAKSATKIMPCIRCWAEESWQHSRRYVCLLLRPLLLIVKQQKFPNNLSFREHVCFLKILFFGVYCTQQRIKTSKYCHKHLIRCFAMMYTVPYCIHWLHLFLLKASSSMIILDNNYLLKLFLFI